MAQTLSQIQAQIATLRAKADQVRQRELKGVIERIKVAIEAYRLTAEDLFGSPSKTARKSNAKAASAIKYADGKGNSWVGRGKRPEWLRSALAAGAILSDFLSSATTTSAAGGGSSSAAKHRSAGKGAGSKVPRAKKPAGVKYRDGAGNSWSGRGRRPKWFVDALAAGKSLTDLAV